MLQQTRVAAAVPYFERFLTRFPNFRSLAAASDDDLLNYWAGLGYYHRARNMRKAAELICTAGAFPDTYSEILKLPGIGDYTSAAVASIAFNQPHAAVDGNVVRVISRVFNERADPASTRGRRQFAQLANKLIDRQNPGAFNQAMMELGATICLPRNPQCLVCPVSAICSSRAAGLQDHLPTKVAKQRAVEEIRRAFWIEHEGRLLAWQRPAGSRLMPGFWELPELVHLPHIELGERLGSFRHGITVHNYRFEIYRAAPPAQLGECRWLTVTDLETLPISTVFKKAKRLRENLIRDLHVLSASASPSL